MQYKFFVDGEWQHDEHQPFVRGDYGVVNTIFLGREPGMTNFTPEAPGRSNMDVDNDVIMRVVRFLFLFYFQLIIFFGWLSLFLALFHLGTIITPGVMVLTIFVTGLTICHFSMGFR